MSSDSRQRNAAEHAYRAYRGHVYRFLLRKTGDHHDAEELTQRVFVDAAAALRADPAGPDSLLGWLYAVAERRFVDDVRRRVAARRGLLQLHRLSHLHGAEEGPDVAYGRQIASALRIAIGDLPEEQRTVVVMKLLQGKRFAEIAEELGTTEAACKMRLQRAVARLKSELSVQGIEPRVR